MLDYKIFNTKGKKIARDNIDSSKMSKVNKIQLEKHRIFRDFDDMVSDFTENDFEPVEKHISELAILFRNYRDVHTID